jgi:putative FmdB family regulatory protein
MPIYEYRCKKCNDQIEVFQKSSDKPPTKCRKCGGRMEKQFSRTSVQFKGEGWYVTDYGRKGSVAEKVETELSSPEPAKTETSKSNETAKSKKTTSKNTGSDKS